MKLAKLQDVYTATIVEVENGKEIGGVRTEEELYAKGFKKLCECGEEGRKMYIEYDTCIIEVLRPDEDPVMESGE